MEKLTDWKNLWHALSEIQDRSFTREKEAATNDVWKHKAKEFDKLVEDRWAKPDSSRDFLIRKLKENPGSTLLDIGAGTGKWSLLCAPWAKKVTALEPSLSMQAVLKEKIDKDGVDNIEIVTESWPPEKKDVPDQKELVEPHDFILTSHSMYGVGDFEAFIRAMNQYAVKGCIMVMRAPLADAVMAKAASRVWGQPYDSPNFQIAYNILLGMDIYADVVFEEKGSWQGWHNDSFETALDELKSRLDIVDDSSHDAFLTGLLEKNLIVEPDGVRWPAANRSALVYWEV